jgi:hypothetical protein
MGDVRPHGASTPWGRYALSLAIPPQEDIVYTPDARHAAARFGRKMTSLGLDSTALAHKAGVPPEVVERFLRDGEIDRASLKALAGALDLIMARYPDGIA